MDKEIDPQDFLKMIDLNRKSIVHFIKKAAKEKNSLAVANNFDDRMFNNSSLLNSDNLSNMSPGFNYNCSPGMRDITEETVGEEDVSMNEGEASEVVWDDETIDERAKEYLKERRMGKILQPDTMAHLEFFYNTRRLHHKTANPFEEPE